MYRTKTTTNWRKDRCRRMRGSSDNIQNPNIDIKKKNQMEQGRIEYHFRTKDFQEGNKYI